MTQQQPNQPTAEEQKQYKEAYDKFAQHYMGLNEWGKIDFLFQTKAQIEGLHVQIAELKSKSGLTISKP